MTALLEPAGPAAAPTDEAIAASERLARFVVEGRVGNEALEQAARSFVDTLAVTLAGGVEPALQRLAGALEPAGNGVPSWWGQESHRSEDAALLTGMASHVLDYDDVCMLSVCHPTAPVLSALLPAAAGRDVSGRELLEALAIGTEVLVRLGQCMGFRHYALGFHATATLGTLGATAAVARLQRLDVATTRHALAIAASLAGGLRKNFGSMVKSLHVGLAASNGIRAAQLARAGIEGAAEPLEAEGYLKAFSGGGVDRWPEHVALGQPFSIVAPGFELKRYPCCYLLHRMIEGTLALRRESGVRLDDVARMRVDMPAGGTKPLIHPFPKSGLNALFSGPYAVAASLADGRIDLKSFTDEAVLRPALQARLRDVTLVEASGESSQGSDLGSAPVTVTLTLKNGGTVSHTVTRSPGSLDDPLTPDQLAAKWSDCLLRARPSLPAERADDLFASGLQLVEQPAIAPWLDALRTALRGL